MSCEMINPEIRRLAQIRAEEIGGIGCTLDTLGSFDRDMCLEKARHEYEVNRAPVRWNGESIITHANSFSWYATLEVYDPTPWDSETPAKGPHAICGCGKTEADARVDLCGKLVAWDSDSRESPAAIHKPETADQA